jgi:hypothetical protein
LQIIWLKINYINDLEDIESTRSGRQKKLYLLVLLSLLSTFIEMGGLSMIFVILSYVLENKYIIDFSLPYLKIFSFISKDNYLFFITLFLFVIYTFKIIFFIFFIIFKISLYFYCGIKFQLNF